MRPIPSSVKLLSSLVVASMLAACSGAGGSNQAGGVMPNGVSQSSVSHVAPPSEPVQAQDEIRDASCKSNGKMSVTPCAVTFTLLDFNAVTVYVKAPNKQDINESNNCTSAGIASISGGDGVFTVTPGLLPGTCTVRFTEKNKKGKQESATLSVTNEN